MSTSGKTVNRYVGCTLCVITARFSLPNAIDFFHVNHENLILHQDNMPLLMIFFMLIASVVGKVQGALSKPQWQRQRESHLIMSRTNGCVVLY